MKIDKNSSTFGLYNSLIIPIAAKSIYALEEYVGEVQSIKNGTFDGYMIDFIPLDTPNNLEVWNNPRSEFLNAAKQLWVHVDDRNYRKLYQKVFPSINLNGYDIDHIFNKALSKMYGFNYVRLLHVKSTYNRKTGSGAEKDSTSFRKNDFAGVNYEIQYADALDMCKLLHLDIGTGEYMDAIANFHLFYGKNTK
jgi:hypothetical protein